MQGNGGPNVLDVGFAALSGDVVAAIGELKAKPVGELQVHGSGVLTRWLLENNLVDEMNLLIVPVVVGHGTRLFPDTGPDIALDLVESRDTGRSRVYQKVLERQPGGGVGSGQRCSWLG